MFPNQYFQFWPSKNCVFVRGNVQEAGNESMDPNRVFARRNALETGNELMDVKFVHYLVSKCPAIQN